MNNIENLEPVKKILIIEDELAYLNLLHDQLVLQGYNVIDAKDGEEGLRLALSEKPDLILLDLIMPKVNGLTMLKELRKTEFGKTVPVVILTNVNESTEISSGIENKIIRYLIKSDWKLDSLLREIKSFLERR